VVATYCHVFSVAGPRATPATPPAPAPAGGRRRAPQRRHRRISTQGPGLQSVGWIDSGAGPPRGTAFSAIVIAPPAGGLVVRPRRRLAPPGAAAHPGFMPEPLASSRPESAGCAPALRSTFRHVPLGCRAPSAPPQSGAGWWPRSPVSAARWAGCSQ
jgi:hypothetical protein